MTINKPIQSAILLFLTLGFFYAGLGGYDLTAPDEPRFALVAREMLTDNHWVLPHRNGNPYPDKPPFFFWAIAAFSALAGGTVNAWTARLPSAVGATIILVLMWRFAKTKETEETVPLLTVLVLMSCALFFFQARIAQIDMVLCMLTTAALTVGYKAMTGKPYSPFWLGMFMGCGILAKGPVGYLIPAGAMALYAGVEGRDAWKRYPVRGLLWGLAPAAVWLLLLVMDVTLNHQWDYLQNLLFKQTVVRYVNSWHHHQPVYYFFVSILHDFLPWTLFLLIAIPVTRKKWRALDDRQRYSWMVIVFTLVFFSLSKGKRSIYILPVFPFAAYLTAVQLNRMRKSEYHSAWDVGAGVLTGILFLVIGMALFIVSGGWIKNPVDWIDAPLPLTWLFTAGLFLTPLAVGMLVFSFKKQFIKVTAAVISAMLVVNLLFFLVMLPWLNPFRSSRGFMEAANATIHRQSENPVVGMVDYRSAYRLYGDFPLIEIARETDNDKPDLPKIQDFFFQHPEGWLIVKEKDWKQFAKTHDIDITIHHMQKLGSGKNMMLVTMKRRH